MKNFRQTADFKLIKQLLITTEIVVILLSFLPILVSDGPLFTSSLWVILFWNIVLPVLTLLIGSFANLIFGIRLVRSALKRYYFQVTPWEQNQLRLQFKFLRKLKKPTRKDAYNAI